MPDVQKVSEAMANEGQLGLFGSNVAPRRRINPRGRDWACIECGNMNKGFMGNCFSCGRKK